VTPNLILPLPLHLGDWPSPSSCWRTYLGLLVRLLW